MSAMRISTGSECGSRHLLLKHLLLRDLIGAVSGNGKTAKLLTLNLKPYTRNL